MECIRQTTKSHHVYHRGHSVTCRIRGFDTKAAQAPVTARYHPGIVSHLGAAGNFGELRELFVFASSKQRYALVLVLPLKLSLFPSRGGESRVRIATSSGMIKTVVHTSDEGLRI